MENNNFLNTYRKEILDLEVSEDTSKNLTKAQNFIQSVIQVEQQITMEDVVELMKVATDHFSFDEDTKKQLVEFCVNLFNKINEDRKYQEEILKRADEEITIDPIFPAIDYRPEYGMIYGIKSCTRDGKELTYIGLSNKSVYEIKDTQKGRNNNNASGAYRQ